MFLHGCITYSKYAFPFTYGFPQLGLGSAWLCAFRLFPLLWGAPESSAHPHISTSPRAHGWAAIYSFLKQYLQQFLMGSLSFPLQSYFLLVTMASIYRVRPCTNSLSLMSQCQHPRREIIYHIFQDLWSSQVDNSMFKYLWRFFSYSWFLTISHWQNHSISCFVLALQMSLFLDPTSRPVEWPHDHRVMTREIFTRQ